MSLWVTDSSPLIFLAKLNRLDLLRNEAEELLAPPAVLGEIGGQDDEAKRQIEEARRTWLHVRAVQDVRLVALLKRELGDGEAEAIALALETDATRIVLDDLSAAHTSGCPEAARER
jgi:predicted nucleic acid-binding protein